MLAKAVDLSLKCQVAMTSCTRLYELVVQL
jgi:hypothetical protein